MNFILCADLHLKETEKEYSFSVLGEIAGLCKKNNSGALLLAGDVFDSREEIKSLRTDFRAALDLLPDSCQVYFLPGNHEELRAKDTEDLESFDFGRAKLLAAKPWSLHDLDADTELLAVPFQKDYRDYRDWEIPRKKKAMRILLAHGTVMGMAYTGPGEETDSIIDEDMITFFQADLAAIGHLHKYSDTDRKNYRIIYPGSARVWREGEEGKRCVLLGNTGTVPVRLEPLFLTSAGEYRVIPVFATPEGELCADIPKDISPADWLCLDLTGVVEEEPPVLAALEKLKTELEKKCRKVSAGTEKLSVLAGVSTHPLAGRFLRKWEEAAHSYKDEEPGVYEQARLRGLLALKDVLEKRK